MGESPTLLWLCAQAITNEIIFGDHYLQNIFELPSDLVDYLIMHLPPLALLKLQEAFSSEHCGRHDFVIDGATSGRKRRRFNDLNIAWKALFESRWPEGSRQIQPMNCLTNQDGVARCDFTIHSGNWQQMYWETHLQNCLEKAAEMALLPSFEGCVGEIVIPDTIMKSIGYKGGMGLRTGYYSTLSHHCQQFGNFARCLRLQNVLCGTETCDLLRDSELQCLVFRSIKSKTHVDGVCKLLTQKSKTLIHVEFIHCWLPLTYLNAICGSLYTNGVQRQKIQHFLIKSSSIPGSIEGSNPTGFLSFLSSGSSLCSLNFSYNHLGPDFAKLIFDTLLHSSSCLSTLELCESNISGFLSKVNGNFSNLSTSSLGVKQSFRSLRVLNLRGNHLGKDDAEDLKAALFQMPRLQCLDISDNVIGDEGIRCLLPYFIQASEKASSLADMKIENCDLSCFGVTQLLQSLSAQREPLNNLSIANNELGCHIAAPLAKFMQISHVRGLNIEDIGLGSCGFLELEKEIPETEALELACINFSKNRGGFDAAKFVSKLILQSPELLTINAGYNFMPAESLMVICAALKLSKGKLERVDLTGNSKCCQPANISMFAEFHCRGKPVVILPSLQTSAAAPYDDDP
ncbi:hypothetical protein MRB53_002768 [Persea americana]|uniref:Uncharacterized protein n=1 Tax=Persea americana TaxID=3435 RepID=A0ACC2MWD3_PERAE|nr:hypothetical protein MRB53_002768 [Persea americana]